MCVLLAWMQQGGKLSGWEVCHSEEKKRAGKVVVGGGSGLERLLCLYANISCVVCQTI